MLQDTCKILRPISTIQDDQKSVKPSLSANLIFGVEKKFHFEPKSGRKRNLEAEKEISGPEKKIKFLAEAEKEN